MMIARAFVLDLVFLKNCTLHCARRVQRMLAYLLPWSGQTCGMKFSLVTMGLKNPAQNRCDAGTLVKPCHHILPRDFFF